MKNIDDLMLEELLQNALSPTYERINELNDIVLMKVDKMPYGNHQIDSVAYQPELQPCANNRRENNMNKTIILKNRTRSFKKAAAIAAALLTVTSATAFAAWNYLSPKDVADRVDDTKLAQSFAETEVFGDSEVQSYGGYDIALIGLISGKDISNHITTYNGKVVNDNTYAVVAISNSDGTPMPDISDNDYGKQNFLVSPYIEGYNPTEYNILTLAAGGYEATVDNGIEYRIMEIENIEAFADHKIYLGVSDGTFVNPNAYIFDKSTGSISRNETYNGVNALFTLPVDKSKADSQKAESIINAVNNRSHNMRNSSNDDVNVNSDNVAGKDMNKLTTDDVSEFMSKLNADNINNYAEPVESTRQTITPDKNGIVNYSYDMPDGNSGNGAAVISELFPDAQTGKLIINGWYSSENDLEDLLIETFTLNDDGTVTYVIYALKN